MLTWNVENYVAEDRLVDGSYRTDYPKPEKAKAALRAVLRAAQAHVVALQEMGPEPYLEELQRDLATEGAAYPHRAFVAGPDQQRHLAILSRVPFVRAEAHARVPLRGRRADDFVRRGVLEATFACEGGEFTLFVVHLKSRHTESAADPFGAAQRAAEAEAVRDLVLRRFPNPAAARFAILGDCNDSPRSRPLRALQRRGETEIAALLPASDAHGDGWTHFYRQEEEYSRFDYVLVSPVLAANGAGAHAEILDSPDVRAASDHRPVLLRLSPVVAAKSSSVSSP